MPTSREIDGEPRVRSFGFISNGELVVDERYGLQRVRWLEWTQTDSRISNSRSIDRHRSPDT
jgi:hypothetical protein